MEQKVDIKNFILASNSQRRREMLRERGYNFQVIASDVETDIVGKKYDRSTLFKIRNEYKDKKIELQGRLQRKQEVIQSFKDMGLI